MQGRKEGRKEVPYPVVLAGKGRYFYVWDVQDFEVINPADVLYLRGIVVGWWLVPT